MYPYSNTRNHRVAEDATLSASEKSLSSKPDQKLLDLLLGALAGEMQSQSDCLYLAEQAPADQAAVLRGIAIDDAKHTQYLQEIYAQLTSQQALQIQAKPSSCTYNTGTMGERAMEKTAEAATYRQLYLSFLSRELRDLFFEIFTDEMMHAQQLLTLSIQCE